MNNQHFIESIENLSNLQHKIKILKEFDDIINQVDIDAETILLRIDQNADKKQLIEKEINQPRKLVIDKINEIKNWTLENLSKTTYASDQPIEDLLVKYCVYLNSDTVRSFTYNKDRLGILLVTDFFISKPQVYKLNEMVTSVLKIDISDRDQEALLIDKHFMENVIILKKLKSQLFSYQFIIDFTSNLFDEITELKLSDYSDSEMYFRIEMERLNEVFTRFSGLKTLNLDKSGIRYLNENSLIICSSGLQSLRVLELKHNNLKILTFNNLPNLEKLDISNNSLRYLPNNIFFQLSNLKYLNLSKNPLLKIEKATLNGLDKLEEISLMNNCCATELEKNTFEDLDNLKIVRLGGSEIKNDFEVVPPKNLEQACLMFGYLDCASLNWLNSAKNLKRLSLCFDERYKIDESLFSNCNELEELDLKEVDLDIEKFPTNLNKLKTIKFEEVRFLKDPENLFYNLNQIECIDIFDFEFLNDSHKNKIFQNLRNLKKLRYNYEHSLLFNEQYSINLDGKCLYVDKKSSSEYVLIDHVVNNNPDLIELDLQRSSLFFESKSLNGLKNLEVFNFNINNLEQLNNELNGLVSLKNLDLSCNKLTRLEDNLFSKNLKHLVELDLSSNELEIISNGMFSNLDNLQVLELSKNSIYKIEKNSFEGLFKLTSLKLNNNGIEELDNQIFQDLINLKLIDLSQNRISQLDNLFDNNLKLNNLNLKLNKIRSINFRSLAKLINCNYLNLQKNRIESIDINDINYFMCCAVNNVSIYLEGNFSRGSKCLRNILKFVSLNSNSSL